MPYTQPIVTEIRRKTDGEFEAPVNISAKQKYVGALLNSHNNNLEEQSILGPDCCTITWTNEENVSYITKKFYNGDLSTVSEVGYYILFITDYTQSTASDFVFEDTGLYLPDYEISSATFVPSGTETDPDILDVTDTEIYDFPTDTNIFQIAPKHKILEEISLCFRTDINDESDEQIESDILISKKLITKNVINNKIVTIEAVENFLED
jgi:hypothetical protein